MAAEHPYSNREIDTFLQDISASLQRIEKQTTTTNGRVTKLERWQSYVLGFCAGISVLVLSVLIPLLGIAAGFFK